MYDIQSMINDLDLLLDVNPNEMVSVDAVIRMLKLIKEEKYMEAITCIR